MSWVGEPELCGRAGRLGSTLWRGEGRSSFTNHGWAGPGPAVLGVGKGLGIGGSPDTPVPSPGLSALGPQQEVLPSHSPHPSWG